MSVSSALRHYFAPAESNKRRAHILHWEFVLLLAVIVVFGNTLIKTQAPQILGFASQINPQEVIRLTNIQRSQQGLGTVTENSLLDRAAAAKAADMFAKGYWAHVAPDGTQPWDFFKSVGYKYKYAGENLARDFSSPSSAVDAWMASPSHRENMLNPKYKDIGVAVLDGSLDGHDATIVVQLFGALATSVPQVPVAAAENVQTASVAGSVNEVPSQVETQVAAAPVSITTTPTVGVSPQLDVSKALSVGVILVLIMTLVVDVIMIWKRGEKRDGSRSIAQIAFLGMILAIILVAKVGQII